MSAEDVEVLVRLQNQASADGWIYSSKLGEVPEETGCYGVSDGLRGMGGGISRNMRESLAVMLTGKSLARPIYKWLPDHDGSSARWLDELDK